MTLWAHLASGASTVARCWLVERGDGVSFGFTDHDAPLAFGGRRYEPEAGLTASAAVSGTGLAVDNAEAMGALSSDAITEGDIDAGRYDGARVFLWLVNWRDVEERSLRFRGTLGEIRRGAGAFRAELRGLTEPLNRPGGRLYGATCPAVLGDGACGVDLSGEGYRLDAPAGGTDGQEFLLPAGPWPDRWFERGVLAVQGGAGAGLSGLVKHDRRHGDRRRVELWAPLPVAPGPEDGVRVTAGCDKRAETCRVKFDNLLNFRGFPTIPGEDWLLSVPSRAGVNDGGSLR